MRAALRGAEKVLDGQGQAVPFVAAERRTREPERAAGETVPLA